MKYKCYFSSVVTDPRGTKKLKRFENSLSTDKKVRSRRCQTNGILEGYHWEPTQKNSAEDLFHHFRYWWGYTPTDSHTHIHTHAHTHWKYHPVVMLRVALYRMENLFGVERHKGRRTNRRKFLLKLEFNTNLKLMPI